MWSLRLHGKAWEWHTYAHNTMVLKQFYTIIREVSRNLPAKTREYRTATAIECYYSICGRETHTLTVVSIEPTSPFVLKLHLNVRWALCNTKVHSENRARINPWSRPSKVLFRGLLFPWYFHSLYCSDLCPRCKVELWDYSQILR
jgi:hypothetical protein